MRDQQGQTVHPKGKREPGAEICGSLHQRCTGVDILPFQQR